MLSNRLLAFTLKLNTSILSKNSVAPAASCIYQTRNYRLRYFERVNRPPRYEDGWDPRLAKLEREDFVYNHFYGEPHSDDLKILMLKPVEGVGSPGDEVSVHKGIARCYMLSKEAVYATPENIEKYKNLRTDYSDSLMPSTHTVLQTKKSIEKNVFLIFVSDKHQWTLEPWMVSVSLRLAGLQVSPDCITLNEKPLSGPNMEINDKEFLALLKINKKEIVRARCRLQHIGERRVSDRSVLKYATRAIFPEEEDTLKELTNMSDITIFESIE